MKSYLDTHVSFRAGKKQTKRMFYVKNFTYTTNTEYNTRHLSSIRTKSHSDQSPRAKKRENILKFDPINSRTSNAIKQSLVLFPPPKWKMQHGQNIILDISFNVVRDNGRCVQKFQLKTDASSTRIIRQFRAY